MRCSVANALRTEGVWLWFAKIVSIATISFAINAAAVSASIVQGVLENSCVGVRLGALTGGRNGSVGCAEPLACRG